MSFLMNLNSCSLSDTKQYLGSLFNQNSNENKNKMFCYMSSSKPRIKLNNLISKSGIKDNIECIGPEYILDSSINQINKITQMLQEYNALISPDDILSTAITDGIISSFSTEHILEEILQHWKEPGIILDVSSKEIVNNKSLHDFITSDDLNPVVLIDEKYINPEYKDKFDLIIQGLNNLTSEFKKTFILFKEINLKLGNLVYGKQAFFNANTGTIVANIDDKNIIELVYSAIHDRMLAASISAIATMLYFMSLVFAMLTNTYTISVNSPNLDSEYIPSFNFTSYLLKIRGWLQNLDLEKTAHLSKLKSDLNLDEIIELMFGINIDEEIIEKQDRVYKLNIYNLIQMLDKVFINLSN